MQDCHSQIAQDEYQGQTQYTIIFEHKPCINTSYGIQHRLELTYFHFAQFLLKEFIYLEKVRTENLKFRTVMDGLSVT